MKIPLMKPRLATLDELKPFLKRIDINKIYTNYGPLVCELEESYSKYLKVDKTLVVALCNATQAIQGLVSISSNRNWIVPDYTFSATGLAVLNANRNLIICDVNMADWKIDTSLIGEKQKFFGIIPVMPFGSPVDFTPYLDFDDVIIDAAASLGSQPPDFCKMRENWAVVYSLHATKVLGAGEGAIVVCGNKNQADLLRAWSNFGFLLNRSSEICGTNAKMSEMNAAYGLYSIKNIIPEREDWLESQYYVTSQTSGYAWSTFVNSKPNFHPYWIVAFKNKDMKKNVIEGLARASIQSREWWAKPLSSQGAFSRSTKITRIKNSKILSNVHLGLPMYRGLSYYEVEKICKVIQNNIK